MHFSHNLMFRRICRDSGLLAFLSLPLLAGCGGGGSNGNSGTDSLVSGTTTTGTNTASAGGGGTTDGDGYGNSYFAATGTTATSLSVGIAASVNTVAVGGTVQYLVIVQNYTAAPIPIHAASTPFATPAVEMTITGPTGAVSYQSPAIPPLAYSDTLAPGQQIVSYIIASGFTTPGTYSVSATFSDDTTALKTVGPLAVTAL